MKRSYLVLPALAALLVLSALAPLPKHSSRDDFRYQPNNAFGIGERLTFDVRYGVITAGQAVLSIPSYQTMSGRKCFKIVSEVSTTKSFDWVFKVRDRYETYLDVEGIFPWQFEQHIREGKYSFDYSAYFDQRHDTAYTTEGKFPTPPYVQDILSAFFYARTLDYSKMKPGDRFHLENFYKKKTHPLDIAFLGRGIAETDAGKFRCVVIEPLVEDGGLFKNEGRIVVWLTDDERKMPVKISTKVVIGSIDVVLTAYDGLRGPLSSKVE